MTEVENDIYWQLFCENVDTFNTFSADSSLSNRDAGDYGENLCGVVNAPYVCGGARSVT